MEPISSIEKMSLVVSFILFLHFDSFQTTWSWRISFPLGTTWFLENILSTRGYDDLKVNLLSPFSIQSLLKLLLFLLWFAAWWRGLARDEAAYASSFPLPPCITVRTGNNWVENKVFAWKPEGQGSPHSRSVGFSELNVVILVKYSHHI